MLGDPIPTLTLPLKGREVGCSDSNKLNAHFRVKERMVVGIMRPFAAGFPEFGRETPE